jgi:serine/threonine-protein kinase
VQKLHYIIQGLHGLNYAHQRGIVHRDIKPGNLMILNDGNVKIVDFGIARMGDASLTRTGQVVGTITYMSPEQINAQVVDGRTDIFSCGVMLYELLTGSNPFDGKDTASTLLKIIHEPPPPLKNFLTVYPPELEEALHRALAKDREERYATAEDFAFDLTRIQESLKKHMVSEYVVRAKDSMEKAELSKAKELLQQVLRVDTQHAIAKELMYEVQQKLQKQQRGEQVRQLRAHADDAINQKAYVDALSYLDQALTLDKTNTELIGLRDQIREVQEKKKKLDDALRRAESAQQMGDLEAAAKAVAEALAADPGNLQAKTLEASISKELEETQKEREVQSYLEEARKSISARKFTSAFEVLTKAEKIDPASPEVHALKSLASSGRDQETRRRDLDKLAGEIQDLLNKDGYLAASQKAEAALQKFPSDPNLLKLKSLADKQHETTEKRKFVEEQVAAANKLVGDGKAAEALAILEKAVQKAPGERRLTSLLAVVRDSAEREQTEQQKNLYIHQAKEAISRKDYAGAVSVLETAQAELEGSAEINDLLQFAKDEAATQGKRKTIDAAAEEAQKLINDGDYEGAVSMLEATMKRTPDEELRVVLTEAKRHVDDFKRKVETAVGRAQRLLESRKIDDAVKFLEGQPKFFARSQAFTGILEKARAEQDQMKGVSGAIEKARAAVQKNDFAAALNIVEACRKTYGETPELKQELTEIQNKRTATAKSLLERAIRDARTLLLARQYGAALKNLEQVADLASAALPELKAQFDSVKKDAASGASRAGKEAEMDKTIVAGSMDASHTIIAGSADYGSGAGKVAPAVPAAAPGVARPAARPGVAPPPAVHAPPRPAPPPPKPAFPIMPVVIGVVALLAIVGSIVGYRMMSTPAAATAYVEINAIPWGTVKSITSTDGDEVQLGAETQTPLRLALAPGEYKVVVAGPTGEEKTETIKVSNESPGSYVPVFEAIDVEKIVQTH